MCSRREGFLHRLAHLLPEEIVGPLPAGDAYDDKGVGQVASAARWYRAGISFRSVRSPLAPKITMAKGSSCFDVRSIRYCDAFHCDSPKRIFPMASWMRTSAAPPGAAHTYWLVYQRVTGRARPSRELDRSFCGP